MKLLKIYTRLKRNLTTPRQKCRQRGSASVYTMIGTASIGLSAIAYSPYAQQQNLNRLVEVANTDVQAIQQSIYAYHIETRRFPADLNTLVNAGFYYGATESPWGTPYNLNPNADQTAISVTYQSPSDRLAERIAKHHGQGRAEGNNVSIAMGRPSREAVLNTFLHRTAQADCLECNTMETSINMANNDLTNVGAMYADTIQVNDITLNHLTTESMDVADVIRVGGAELRSIGNAGLSIHSETTQFGGNLSMSGNLIANGGDFTGFSTVATTTLTAQSVNSTDMVTNTLVADSAKFDRAQVDDLSAVRASFQDGSFQTLDVQDLTAANAQIDSLTSTTVRFDEGVFNQLSTTQLKSDVGNIDTLKGNTLFYAQGEVVELTANNLTATTGEIAELSGSSLSFNAGELDQLKGQSATYTQATFNSTSADEGTFTDLVTNALYAVDLTVSGSLAATSVTATDVRASNANFARVDAGTVTADRGRFTQLNADSVTFNDLTTDRLNAQRLSVSGTTTTSRLSASSSSLGEVSGSSMSLSGALDASSLSAGSGSFGSVIFGSGSGGSLSLSGSVNAGSGTFNSLSVGSAVTGDASSSRSSINTNFGLIETYIHQWNQCKAAGGCK